MRRPSALVVDTQIPPTTLQESARTPRSSTYSIYSDIDLKHSPTHSSEASIHSVEQPPLPIGPSPSIRLLFSLISRRHVLLLLLPAMASSIIAGGIAPFMTFVIGQAFDAFASFPLTPNPPQSAKDSLLRGVGLASLELIGLGAGALLLSSFTSWLWIWLGERNAMALRKKVYAAVTHKEMVWFDMKMGAEGNVQSVEDEDGPLGAGGLMAKFSRETDDVRAASSLASGMILQYLTTTLTCLALAFTRSYSLTLVVLSTVPLLVFIQGFSQSFAAPLLANDRQQNGIAATLVDRAVAAIATVKAFNASRHEHDALLNVLKRIDRTGKKLHAVWGVSGGFSQFVMMGMFVQGFWFGASLVRSRKASAGDVMAVFWACLIATNNLQMCIPQFIILTKGKFAMASLLSLVDSESITPGGGGGGGGVKRAKGLKRTPTQLRKIVPPKCYGEFSLHNVTFAYPSRPSVPVLSDVSLYLPANETTFIVGGSGSGKSTIAQLLLRLYDPQSGSIQLDDQDLAYLDRSFTKQNVACVSQNCILFDATVHENVAMGAVGRDVTREEVEEACRAALMHEFVRDLPDGYDTQLGNGGASLSGGQKQRLAIARAKLRNPNILILDEATSALDATSRILVFEALKRWRKDKTTIVITHDLSQINPNDFVYVLKGGNVVEQGYRADLELSTEEGGGEFRAMMQIQGATGGFLPEKDIPDDAAEVEKVEEILKETEEEVKESRTLKRSTLGNWMLDAVAELTRVDSAVEGGVRRETRQFIHPTAFTSKRDDLATFTRPRRPSSIHVEHLPQAPTKAHTTTSRRLSLQYTPTSTVFSHYSTSLLIEDDASFEEDKKTLKSSASRAALKRKGTVIRARWDDEKLKELITVKVEKKDDNAEDLAKQQDKEFEAQQPFWKLVRDVYPTIPHKPFVLLGLIACVASGAMTPVFSFLLSRLLFEVSIGATNVSTINKYGGIVLGIAAIDGLLLGLKFFIMETSGMLWVTRLRSKVFPLLLAQDKKYFDRSENSPPRLVQVLIKDGDDARNLIGVVFGQCLVVVTMLGVGLIWALVKGWQLTLVGFAIAPVFGGVMSLQTGLVGKCELRNKRAREEVAKGYYEAISNIRGIRSMGFETLFQEHFERATDLALSTGVRGAFVEGCTYGVASSLIYLAEALLFYVGAVLISKGTYTYLQMVEVLNLVVFTVTIGSQLMAFTEKIAKSTQATRDFNRLLKLTTDTEESHGDLKPPFTGDVTFDHVSFSYPERPDVQVLKDVSIDVTNGECVAIVGASGSGKSTVAALLQRLYEPDSGSISIGSHLLSSTDVTYLREHVSVVSQNPNLFDATISENIAYGNPTLSTHDIQTAAKAANVHDFIMSLPNGYDTMVGENASLISGGQAQRLQIARALARPSKILILDECTSALDASNQSAVMETIRHAKIGRTTVMVTHKLAVMRMCDRILVVHDGEVKEQGTYEQLMGLNGVFAQLASGGEWSGE